MNQQLQVPGNIPGQQPKLTHKDRIAIPAMIMPAFRTSVAIQNKTERNLLFRTWGGIGDQICAEPTLRYAMNAFPGCDVSIESDLAPLFSHLQPKRMYSSGTPDKPNYEKHFVFNTIVNSDDIVWQFFSHCLTNCVDFPSLCSLRMTLPIEQKEILLTPGEPKDNELTHLIEDSRYVFVHAGRHWPSKTFPKDWWDNVLKELINSGYTPVLIGADADDNRGTVDVDSDFCIDLRNRTTLEELAWLLQRASILITNDSSPLHIAASRDPRDETTGQAWIGYVATCKHPDYITHWRRNDSGEMEFQWREENLGLGGIWDITSNCPNNAEEIKVDEIDEPTLRSWLPEPSAVVKWVEARLA